MPALPLENVGVPMRTAFYRFMHLNSDGHVFMRDDLELPDDITAVEEATKRATKNPIEIWEGSRRVALVQKGNRSLRPNESGSL